MDIELITDYLKHIDDDFKYVSHFGNTEVVIIYSSIDVAAGTIEVDVIDLISFVYSQIKKGSSNEATNI